MQITINGEVKEISPGLSILTLLNQLSLEPTTVVVECDKAIINPDDYAGTSLWDGANLEIIRFVGGG